MPHYNSDMRPGIRYTRINGRKASDYVTKRVPFTNSNKQLYGHWEGAGVPYSEGSAMRYVVYSYGDHWPLFVWDDASQRWYGNSDRHSVTTSKHRTYAHPRLATGDTTNSDTTNSDNTIHWLPLMSIRLLAREGYAALAAARVHGA